MTKKQIKIWICFVQALSIGTLFLPMGKISGSGLPFLNGFDVMRRYADLGFFNDALAGLVLACCLPVLSVLCLFLRRERRNFGTVACLGAFQTMVSACFFSSVKAKMATLTMTGLHYITVMLLFAVMWLAIFGFLISAPNTGETV